MTVNPLKLQPGDMVTVSEQTPIMPRLNHEEIKGRIIFIRKGDAIHLLSKGRRFNVIGSGIKEPGVVWYKVTAMVESMLVIGWMNSRALYGQNLQKKDRVGG